MICPYCKKNIKGSNKEKSHGIWRHKRCLTVIPIKHVGIAIPMRVNLLKGIPKRKKRRIHRLIRL
jgi:hypothetical protein